VFDRRSRTTSTRQRLTWLTGGALLGAGAALLADPDRGRHRRAQLAEQGSELARQAAAAVGQDAGDPAVSGAADELTPDLKDPSDAVLIERVRSDAIGPSDVRNSAIVTTVEAGVVTLRGQVDDRRQHQDLIARVLDVDGVQGIEDLTHLPSEPAPTRS
jgi:osmotically-inducible protein OsmY